MAKRSDEKLFMLPETAAKKIPEKVLRESVSTIAGSDPEEMELALLLTEAHALKMAEGRLKRVKARIMQIVTDEGLVLDDGTMGVRYGGLCSVVRWQNGRETFSKELAVEAGVTPAQIAASMKRGDGYWLCELQAVEGLG